MNHFLTDLLTFLIFFVVLYIHKEKDDNNMKDTLIDVALGSQLKEARQSKRLTMQAVADSVGITKQAYYYYENGKRSMTISMLINICNVLNLKYSTVIDNANMVVYGSK